MPLTQSEIENGIPANPVNGGNYKVTIRLGDGTKEEGKLVETYARLWKGNINWYWEAVNGLLDHTFVTHNKVVHSEPVAA